MTAEELAVELQEDDRRVIALVGGEPRDITEVGRFEDVIVLVLADTEATT